MAIVSIGGSIMLTNSGTLLLVNKDYPTGFHINLNLPPIKMIVDITPIGLLDASGDLHFMDLAYIIYQQTGAALIKYTWPSDKEATVIEPITILHPIIENVRKVTYGLDIAGTSGGVLLLDNDGVLSCFSGVHYLISEREDMIRVDVGVTQLMGNTYLKNGDIYWYDVARRSKNGGKLLYRPNHPVVDVMLASVSKNYPFYIIDDQGYLTLHTSPHKSEVLGSDIVFTRLFRNYYNRKSIAEDDGGNIHILPHLQLWNCPIVLNDPINDLLDIKSIKSARKQ